jgi:predicted nucleic acid-binding protein
MRFVVDASVAVKWLRPEPRSPEARALVTPGTELLAPSLLPIEVANILWRLARLKQLRRTEAHRLLDLLTKAMPHPELSERLLPRALVLSTTIDHPVYDRLFALAERENAVLVTDDQRISSLGSKLKGVSVKPLRP